MLVVAVVGPGCTVMQAVRGPESAEADTQRDPKTGRPIPRDPDFVDPDPRDEEAGVRQLSRLLRRFNRALARAEFTEAQRLLDRANYVVRSASSLTRSHPEYDDTAETVSRARDRLEIAIAEDRRLRRERAITGLVARGDRAVAEANTLYASFAGTLPDDDQLEALQEVITTLTDLQDEGRPYAEDPRYREHAEGRDLTLSSLVTVRDRIQWQLEASDRISQPLEAAYKSALAARKIKNISDQLTALRRAAAGFQSCLARIAALENLSTYDPTLEVETILGTLSLTETQRKCAELSRQSGAKVAELSWQLQLQTVSTQVDIALKELRGQTNPAASLRAHQAAVQTLAACTESLQRIENHLGYNPKKRFGSSLGRLTATELRAACAQRRDRFARDLPNLTWQASLEPLLERATALNAAEKSAKKAPTPDEQARQWGDIVDGYRRCSEQTQEGLDATAANTKFKLKTPWGRLTLGALDKECRRRQVLAEKAQDAAQEARELEAFVATLYSDERKVAQREGIPTRIENFDGGRVFIYERSTQKGGTDRRRFGFDRQGQRKDYWAEWRTEIVAVVAELTRSLQAIKTAKTATLELAATQNALPVLLMCQDLVESTRKNPGYDANATFTTPWSRVGPTALIAACRDETTRLEATLDGLGWKARVETLSARVDEAHQSVVKAKAEKDIDARLSLLGQASGGLQECVERAESLATEENATSDFKLKNALGRVTLAGMGQGCAAYRTTVSGLVEAARKDKKRQDFIALCQGDEVEVVRRMGIPDFIEKLKSGRIFVYKPQKAKASPRRIAFNAQGQRVDESLLKRDAQPPVVIRPKLDENVPLPELAVP